MNQNIVGIIISYVFVFGVIILATVIQKAFKLTAEFSRKIIHIVVGNWIFIALHYFDSIYYALIGPVSFILINYLSYKFTIFKAMELAEKNPGTIYYSISLTILTLLTFSKAETYLFPYLGMMAMTWGDGVAAVVGKKFPVRKIYSTKSVGGSSAFIIFTLLASVIYLCVHHVPLEFSTMLLIAVVFAVGGSIIEIFSPQNLDNLTVPIILGISGLMLEMKL